ncbi:hypothetical protein GJAV_G00241490 [Gymnothorax javanicus]|nr:hypothetical protein GJAV_G00241490 [Gymnothorax javanicus]
MGSESQARSTSNSDVIRLPLDRAMGKAGADSGEGSCRRRQSRRPGYLRQQQLEGESRRPRQDPHLRPSTPLNPSPSPPSLPSTSPAPPSSDRPLPPSDRLLLPSDSSLGSSGAVSPCKTDSLAPSTSAGEQFTSSFSFIRLSLTSEPRSDCNLQSRLLSTPPKSGSAPVSPKISVSPPPHCAPLSPHLSAPPTPYCAPPSPKILAPPQPPPPVAGPALLEHSVTLVTDKPLDRASGRWVSRGCDPVVTPELKDLLPLDSDSLDSSDSASACSASSGYESAAPCVLPSATPSGDAWDGLLKWYERVLQDCLHSNRRNAQIEEMMLRLQKLQQKAILEDDYDTAERVGQTLAELQGEKGTLQLGLPSTHPALSHLLQRLQGREGATLQDTARRGREKPPVADLAVDERGQGCAQIPERRRERREQLLQEQKVVQEEMHALRRRLQLLQERNQRLEEELQLEAELEGGLGPALQSCSPAHLQELRRGLKEQEAALQNNIRETTAKMVMSQRVGGGLRRKVSASESQLLTLHEAKMAAISGSDFSGARELKAEFKAVSGERDWLESLARRLQALSLGNSRELARMKSEHALLQQNLKRTQAQYESSQKESTLKYAQQLEDKLHSHGNSVLGRIWEADLEACRLLLRAASCRGTANEEAQSTQTQPPEPCPKQEQDCAMLTALGGRWCAETGLQHSEFTKKLEEFLFCTEDSQDPCDAPAEVTEILQEEIQEVKASLQSMLRLLEEEEDDDMEERTGEEDEDHYFSDSWTI